MVQVRVMVADSRTGFRRNVRRVCELEESFELVGEAENGCQAVALAHQMRPDVILMAIEMPILDGVQATQLVTAQCSSTRVIALGGCLEDGRLLRAIKAGAYGCLPKDVAESRLVEAIQAVHRGEALIDSYVTARILEEFRRITGDGTRLGSGRD